MEETTSIKRYHPERGQTFITEGRRVRICWSPMMIGMLRRDYPTTFNEELAGAIGVSVRTMIRKARELGLEKDRKWLSDVWDERRKFAIMASRRKGYPGAFKKGEHHCVEHEFKKGHGRIGVITENHKEGI